MFGGGLGLTLMGSFAVADVRIPPQTAIAAQLGRAQPLARPEAVRAAQRAFFQAAMNNTPAPTQVISAAPAAARSLPAARKTDGEPSQFARPGSLLDIKV